MNLALAEKRPLDRTETRTTLSIKPLEHHKDSPPDLQVSSLEANDSAGGDMAAPTSLEG